MDTQIILASASPRRVELLRSLGLAFEILPSHAEELHDPSRTASELCATNAARKAGEVARAHPDALVLGADTLVAWQNTLFGKPRDLEEAGQMLQTLSGRTHQVVTGVCLWKFASNQREVFTEQTEVTFKQLDASAIRDYLSLVHVLDKAGAYAIQEHGEMLVERISGSLSNVIGLPIEKLASALSRWRVIPASELDKIAAIPKAPDPGN